MQRTLTSPCRRFLRARRFSPPEAFQQFKDTEDWRKEHQIDNLYKTIDIQEYEETRRLVIMGPALPTTVSAYGHHVY